MALITLFALLQGRHWRHGWHGSWGMIVMIIFWILIVTLLLLIIWFFYRILTGRGRQGRGPDEGPP